MTKFLASTAIALSLISVPAQAQLLGGGLGGGLGLPIGSIGGAGDVSVSRVGRSVEATTSATVSRSVRAPRVRETVRNPDVTASATGSVSAAAQNAGAALDARITGSTGSAVRGSGKSVRKLRTPDVVVPQVIVPTLPDLAIRRSAIVAGGIAPISIVEVPTYVQRQYVVIEEALEGTGATVTHRDNQIFIDMPADVTFAFDKSDIRPRFKPALDALARTLNEFPAMYIDIEGHTDSIGTVEYNQGLSERRAGAVASYLSQRAVVQGRMQSRGFSKLQPKESNATAEGRAANRRVEIILTPHAG